MQDAAKFVINSLLKPVMTGGIVMAVGIRGHADQDLQKTGKARLDFEQKVSEERAKQVAAALMKAIKAKAFLLEAPLPSGEPFEPVIEGVGATMLLKRNPANEQERSLNRRVDIFLLRDWEPLTQLPTFDVPPQKSFKT